MTGTKSIYVAMVLALFAGLSYPVIAASPPVRISQVNAALREAGLPVNEFSQRSFAAGIAAGHYRTYEHLVDAMKWHKSQDRFIANFGTFAGFDDAPIILRLSGRVGNINEEEVELRDANYNGHLINKKFDVSLDTKLDSHIMRGSMVEVEYLPGTVRASRVNNLAPEGMEAFWGPVGL
ncbi:MAG: hypothetical protein HYZ61_01770 [Candidatus Andersenbacteria bacterium]|nr:hypothetical protein [Candidatus Andersenbacteria bacterium]